MRAVRDLAREVSRGGILFGCESFASVVGAGYVVDSVVGRSVVEEHREFI